VTAQPLAAASSARPAHRSAIAATTSSCQARSTSAPSPEAPRETSADPVDLLHGDRPVGRHALDDLGRIAPAQIAGGIARPRSGRGWRAAGYWRTGCRCSLTVSPIGPPFACKTIGHFADATTTTPLLDHFVGLPQSRFRRNRDAERFCDHLIDDETRSCSTAISGNSAGLAPPENPPGIDAALEPRVLLTGPGSSSAPKPRHRRDVGRGSEISSRRVSETMSSASAGEHRRRRNHQRADRGAQPMSRKAALVIAVAADLPRRWTCHPDGAPPPRAFRGFEFRGRCAPSASRKRKASPIFGEGIADGLLAGNQFAQASRAACSRAPRVW